MNFFQLQKNLKLRELHSLENLINDLLSDPNRSVNTDSVSRLFYQRDRLMQELQLIYEAEKAALTRIDPRDERILNDAPNLNAGNIHGEEENVENNI
jgi:hypothetical protein